MVRGSSSYSGSSGSGGSGGGRVRSVTLVRRSPPPTKLGFSLRGGKEHSTGFFVTAVEPNSEAHHQGLVVGDQIIRVNGFPVEDATHKEVLQLIQGQNPVTLKVKSVGMIPVKENPDDELSWQIVDTDPPLTNGNGTSHFKQEIYDHSGHRSPNLREVRLILKVPPKAKLGCGICKGPEWKPGVFVQFTKENSIARQSGLRPGDQIIQCNNFTFTPDTPFSEAVSVLKCSGVLELFVRKGAGLELFPGESSGYNSSASSVAGDNPPSWPHRLSSLPEENSNHLAINGELSNHLERGRDGDGVKTARTEYTNGCTVIHVGSDESDSKNKVAEICMVSKQVETKTTTVFVEVHHSEDDNLSHTQSDTSTDRLTNSSSVSSFTSSASSLSSAISQELERRSKRQSSEGTSKAPAPKPSEKLIKSGMAKEKVQQHEQLMQEFKKAHKKMFSPEEKRSSQLNVSSPEREESRLPQESFVESGIVQSCIDAFKNEPAPTAAKPQEVEKVKSKRQTAPPPPPPLPTEGEGSEGSKTGVSGKKGPAPPPPSPPYCPTPDYDTTSLASEFTEETKPKPKVVNGQAKGPKESVEMQSLESFKLTNPLVSRPRPPSTYFASSETSSGTASTVAVQDPGRPIVTIREYPGNSERKNPNKFDFLKNGVPPQGPPPGSKDQNISSRLQTELSQTLSRANLSLDKEQVAPPGSEIGGGMKGTVVTISVQSSQEDAQKQAPFYLFPNGNQPSAPDKKITDLVSAINNRSAFRTRLPLEGVPPQKNSVTFNFSKPSEKEVKPGSNSQPNGILKNGNNNNNNHHNNNVSHVQIQSHHNDKIGPQKSIKFGGITTIIRDAPHPKV